MFLEIEIIVNIIEVKNTTGMNLNYNPGNRKIRYLIHTETFIFS